MTWKLRKSATFSLSACGELSFFDPVGQQETRLSPELVEMLCCIGRGDDLAAWANERGVNGPTIDVCLETLANIHLIADEELESRRPQPLNSRQNTPAFVISTMRSGSTLLRYLLDTHEHIACPPESKFLGGLYEFMNYPDTQVALKTLGFDLGAAHDELRQLTERILGGYAKQRNKRRWVDKTPNYYRILDFIDALFSRDVLYVCLVRHPLDNIQSLQDMWLGYGGLELYPDLRLCVDTYGRGRMAYAHYWRQTNEIIYTFGKAHPDRCHFVRYEDIVAAPRETLSRLFAFLGETYDESIPERAFSSDHTLGYQDHKITKRTRIDAESVGRWKAWEPGEIAAIGRMVNPLAVELGYASLLDA
jgi:hypothetical protein